MRTQRKFRNAVVRLIRVRLTDRYGDAAAQRVAKAFPTWAEIKAAAALSCATAVVSHTHVDGNGSSPPARRHIDR